MPWCVHHSTATPINPPIHHGTRSKNKIHHETPHTHHHTPTNTPHTPPHTNKDNKFGSDVCDTCDRGVHPRGWQAYALSKT